jgi:hypothetical protein
MGDCRVETVCQGLGRVRIILKERSSSRSRGALLHMSS